MVEGSIASKGCNMITPITNQVGFKADTLSGSVRYNNRNTKPMPNNYMDDEFLMQAIAEQNAKKKEKSKEKWYKAGVLAQIGLAAAFTVMAGGTVFSLIKQYGKNAGKLSKFEFSDIAKKENFPKLSDECVNPKVREFIQTMQSRATFSDKVCKLSGTKAPEQCLLMYGPSGTGKTFSAKMLAKEIGAEYAEVQFADVSSPYIGQTSVEIKKVFDKLVDKANAQPNKKFLVAFNEIDALLVPREKCGSNNLHLAENRTAFLNGLDQIKKFKNIKIVGTTNVDPKSGNLDAASLSRFGNMLKIDLPTEKELIASLKFHLKDCEAIQKHKFFEDNSAELLEFAKELRANKYSQRDVEKMAEIAKTKFGMAISKSSNMENEKFTIQYLKEALAAKGKTTGAISEDAQNWEQNLRNAFRQESLQAPKAEQTKVAKKGWFKSIFSRNT